MSADAPPSAAPATAPAPAGGRLSGGGTAGGKAKESLAGSLGAGSVVLQRHQLQQAIGCRVARQGRQHKAGGWLLSPHRSSSSGLQDQPA